MDFSEIAINSFVKEVSQFSSGWHPRKFCFVLGAGASISSGIKSGQELVDIWDRELSERNELDYKRWKQNCGINNENKYSFYSRYYEKRYERAPSDGKSFLEELMSSAKPSVGYVMLAHILTHFTQSMGVVITTNFDHLIEDAIHDYEHYIPLVIGHSALAHYVVPPLSRPTVIKIHHDLLFDPKNTPQEVSILASEWEYALETVFSEYHPIFIGYAGNDASLMDFLKLHVDDFACKRWKYPYWLTYKGDVPNSDIKKFVYASGGYLITHDGFDETLFLLGNKLNYQIPTEKEFLKESKERFKNLSQSFDKLIASRHTKANESVPVKSQPARVDSPELYRAIDKVAENSESQRMFNEAIKYDNNGDYEMALKIEARLVNRDHQNALYRYQHGVTLSNLKRFDEAAKELAKAVKLDPHDALFRCDLGLALIEIGRHKDALLHLKKAVDIEPDDMYFRVCLADALIDTKQPELAIPHLQVAIEMNSDDAYIHMRLSDALCDIGQYVEALNEIDFAIKLDPNDAYLHFQRGNILLDVWQSKDTSDDTKNDTIKDAQQEYEKAIDIDSTDAMYHNALAELLYKDGNLSVASEELRRAIELEPDKAYLHHFLGQILREMSEDICDSCIMNDELDNESFQELDEVNTVVESFLGKSLDVKDEEEAPFNFVLLDQAIDELSKAAELAPENDIYQYDLGDALWDSGKLYKAAVQIKKAVAINPNNDQYLTTLNRIEAEINVKKNSR